LSSSRSRHETGQTGFSLTDLELEQRHGDVITTR
jgi:hypothetical protein